MAMDESILALEVSNVDVAKWTWISKKELVGVHPCQL